MQQDVMTGLARLLREADPSDPRQVAEAETLAGAAMTMAMAFVQERLGRDAAFLVVNSLFQQAAQSVAGNGAQEDAGASIPTLNPAPRKEAVGTVQGWAETMLGSLNGRPSPETDAEAQASIWAAAAYLRGRHGEGAALDYLRSIQAKVGLLGWFELLPVASTARH